MGSPRGGWARTPTPAPTRASAPAATWPRKPLDHSDHVALIRDAVKPGQTWLELGSGTGAFTLALADLLGKRATIHSVDTDRGALATQATAVHSRFEDVRLDQRIAAFTPPLGFGGADGGPLAHSLHF